MRNRLPFGVWALLMLTVAGGASVATGRELGRLAALAAKQDLYDEVCIALADGSISRDEQRDLLSFGKDILKPDEYQQFRVTMSRLPKTTYRVTTPQRYDDAAFTGGNDFWKATVSLLALDRLTPPRQPPAKRSMNIVQKRPPAGKKSPLQAEHVVEPAKGPVFPVSANLPDEMVPPAAAQ
jgi:hypothetical protein